MRSHNRRTSDCPVSIAMYRMSDWPMPGQQITHDAQQFARSASPSAPPADDEPMRRFFFFKSSVSPGGGSGRTERCTMVGCGCA